MKIFQFTILFLLTSLFVHAQVMESETEETDLPRVKRVALGVKLGIPNLISGSAELILPFLNNHFAPTIEYSKIGLNFENIETNISYTEYGVNYYFNQKGNGLFIGVGKASLSTDITFTDLIFSNAIETITGSGSTNLDLETTNFKIGIKTGGTFYFKFEVGYGMGTIPSVLNFQATANGITESFSEDIPPIPGLGKDGILIGTIGFGIAF
ncbi:MAG: hypothetical protein O3C13_08040 [Bacteroidetes bacterium]|nr:hypothetical protein [Bacteroidota bacterium]